jgi:hypothetical protein
MNKKHRTLKGCQKLCAQKCGRECGCAPSGILSGCGVLVDELRWCRSPSLAQPPAKFCQASGLKTSALSHSKQRGTSQNDLSRSMETPERLEIDASILNFQVMYFAITVISIQ